MSNIEESDTLPQDETSEEEAKTLSDSPRDGETITITFNANGGSGAPSPIVTVPSIVTLPEQIPTLNETTYPGWKFYAWVTAASYTTVGGYFPGQAYLFLHTLDLYAAWRITRFATSTDVVNQSRYLFFANNSRQTPESEGLPENIDASFFNLTWGGQQGAYYSKVFYIAEAATSTQNYNPTALSILWRTDTSGMGPLVGNLGGKRTSIVQSQQIVIAGPKTTQYTGPIFTKIVMTVDAEEIESWGYEFLGWWVQTYNQINYQWVAESDAQVVKGYRYTSTTTENDFANKREFISPIVRLKRWTCTFDAQGGTVSPSSIQIVSGYPYGRLNNGELPTPVRIYYSFTGWFTESGTQVTAQTVVASAGDVTLFAHWVNMTFTVTFDAQGGTVTPSTISGIIGDIITLPTPTRSPATSYRFAGWYYVDASQSEVFVGMGGDPYEIQGDITLIAHWQSTYTVTFDAQGGTVTPSSISGAIGEIITLPTPTRAPATSYRFAGWYYVDASQSEVFVGMGGDPYEIQGDITLIAHWHSMTSGNILIRQTPEWATSATWSYEDYGEDSRAASGSDPGAIGMLRWQIVLPSDPKTYFESIHFGIWGDDGYIGTYPSSTTPWGPIEVCGPPPSQEMEGEFEVPYRWGDYIDVQTLAGMTVEYAYIFRQSNALLYWGDKIGTPLAANNEGKLMYGHKAYTPEEAAKPAE